MKERASLALKSPRGLRRNSLVSKISASGESNRHSPEKDCDSNNSSGGNANSTSNSDISEADDREKDIADGSHLRPPLPQPHPLVTPSALRGAIKTLRRNSSSKEPRQTFRVLVQTKKVFELVIIKLHTHSLRVMIGIKATVYSEWNRDQRKA
jgi:hypothetical protein